MVKSRKNNKFINFKQKKIKKTKKYRIEKDFLGKVRVEKNKYWGSETQRSIQHFSIGNETIPLNIINTYALYKKCAAIANKKLKLFKNNTVPNTIVRVCNEIITGNLNSHFPLHIWQTGSGTHTNMNLNEVIANKGMELLKRKKIIINPNDDVNKSQSSNDSFPVVMNMSCAILIHNKLLSSIDYLIDGLSKKQKEFRNIIKIGRTHLEDATPISFGQEFSGYISLIKNCHEQIKLSLNQLYKLPVGATAVGTGINTHPKYAETVIKVIKNQTNLPFKKAENNFALLSCHNPIQICSGALTLLASNLMKICNDIRWMGSGPKTGLKELILPANEPGSSIMPGKINPSQCEAAIMVALKVMGNNNEIINANSQGNFELNIFNPLMALNITQSINLLNDVCINLTKYCILGLKVNKKQIEHNDKNVLTIATALNPHIGYNKASKLAMFALKNDLSLEEANEKLKILDKSLLNKYLDVSKMI